MAASSLEISQESFSVNMRIFRAERKWAYSVTSSRPSQLVQLPWWYDHTVHIYIWTLIWLCNSCHLQFRTISVPWSDSCTQQRSQGKESSSAQPACPSACSKICGSFSPQAPAHKSMLFSMRKFDLRQFRKLKKIFVTTKQNIANIKPTNLPTWRQTLDFSSRYCSTRAPSIAPPGVKLMSMYFPKRLELSFRIVLALPKAEKKMYISLRGSVSLWRLSYHFMFCSYPPKWGSLQESAARSRSAGRSLQPGIAAWAWCSQFSLLLILHWWGKMKKQACKKKIHLMIKKNKMFLFYLLFKSCPALQTFWLFPKPLVMVLAFLSAVFFFGCEWCANVPTLTLGFH